MGLVSARSTTTGRRPIAGALFALFAVAVGARGVAIDFHPARERLVVSDTAPENGPSIVRTIPVSRRPLSVVVAQVRGGVVAAPLDVLADGRLLARAELQAGQDRRVDVQVPVALGPGQRLELSCPAPGWSLRYLEVANQHGFSSGAFSATFLPAARHDYMAVPVWLLAPIGLALFALWTPTPSGVHRAWRLLSASAAGIGLVTFALVLAAPLVSAYAVVLSIPTYSLCVVLVFGPSLARRYPAMRERVSAALGNSRQALDAVVVVVAISIFFVAAAFHGLDVNDGDYTRLLHISDRFVTAPVLNDYPQIRRSLISRETGYDGQFMYLMAFDPLLRRFEPARYEQIVDSPPYRYGRIGFSLLTWVFSGGNPVLFPRVMIWLIVAGNVIAAWFLVMIARRSGASAWEALPYVLIPGLLISLGNALPESIAAAFLLGGLWAHLRSRTALAICLWSVSLLVRETGLILIAIVVVAEWWQGRQRAGNAGAGRSGKQTAALLLAVVPVAAWRAYAGFRLAPAFGWHTWRSDYSELSLPLSGFFHLWSLHDAIHAHGPALWFPLLLVALLVVAVALLQVRRSAVAAAAVAYGLLAISFEYQKVWSWVGNGERVTFEVFLLVLVASFPFATLPRALRWSLAAFALLLFAYDFQIGTYRAWFRPALLLFQ